MKKDQTAVYRQLQDAHNLSDKEAAILERAITILGRSDSSDYESTLYHIVGLLLDKPGLDEDDILTIHDAHLNELFPD